VVHAYQFIFKCRRCATEVTEVVTSPDILAREELNQIELELRCSNPECRWTESRTGAEAEKIKAALKPMEVNPS